MSALSLSSSSKSSGKVSSTCSPSMPLPMLVFRLLLGVFLISCFVLGIFFFDALKGSFIYVLAYIDDLGPLKGSIALSIANIVGALMFLPCLPFTLGAGLLYGTFLGSAIISIASTIAAVVAFLTARYLARRWIEQSLGGKGSKFRLLDNAINQDGFRIVFLIRSSPIHPYGVCNYLFGLTSITIKDYTIASFIAMLPATTMEVYCGTAMKDVADIINGNLERSFASRLLFWGGLLVSVVVTVLITVMLKNKLKVELAKYKQVSTNDDSIDFDLNVIGGDPSESENDHMLDESVTPPSFSSNNSPHLPSTNRQSNVISNLSDNTNNILPAAALATNPSVPLPASEMFASITSTSNGKSFFTPHISLTHTHSSYSVNENTAMGTASSNTTSLTSSSSSSSSQFTPISTNSTSLSSQSSLSSNDSYHSSSALNSSFSLPSVTSSPMHAQPHLRHSPHLMLHGTLTSSQNIINPFSHSNSGESSSNSLTSDADRSPVNFSSSEQTQLLSQHGELHPNDEGDDDDFIPFNERATLLLTNVNNKSR